MGQLRDEILLKKVILRIKKLREDQGVTLDKFYKDTNIHLARIESAKVNISISTLCAICKYFNVSMAELLKGL
jgi:transcriptional regulator with XRE-family HTH domain